MNALSQRADTVPDALLSAAPHLRQLEAESIHIIREVAAECRNPVFLYSIGKDSSVLLHLIRKAFYPSRPPFPLLHIDTGWKFREMIQFRDETARRYGLDLIVHTNEEARAQGVNPFDHGGYYTHAMKTEALKEALRRHAFDAAFGGARRDEEKSRAKERVFSFRTAAQQWDPKSQRPEFWRLYNGRVNPGESMRVFPLSNWTELDVWQYILAENIPVVPLYRAAPRPAARSIGADHTFDVDPLDVAGVDLEVVVLDDHSTDGTADDGSAGYRGAEVVADHTGLDVRGLGLRIDRQDPVEMPRGVDDQAVADRVAGHTRLGRVRDR